LSYFYEELESDLSIGHELHVKYKDKEYSISNNKAGWYLSEFCSEYQSFSDTNELLEKGKINGRRFKEIRDDVQTIGMLVDI
jgi:hypothetical protein